MGESVRYRRRSARILLVDGADRLLLLRFLIDSASPARGYAWFTPGGGRQRGETLAQSAARELFEEVGLRVAPDELGEPVAYTAGHAELGWANGLFRDDFFFHRVGAHEVDTSGMESLERGYHDGHRWWRVAELAVTTDVVYPFDLARLLTDLLDGRAPRPARRLPWHH